MRGWNWKAWFSTTGPMCAISIKPWKDARNRRARMSIQFGICQSRGNFVERRDLVKFAERTEHLAPDGTHLVCRNQIAMGFQPFHTHLRSELEDQPLVDEQGNMLTLDGRIDNHRDLCELLEIPDSEVADSKILSAAFMHWGAECFSKLIGDWAV